MPNPIVAGLLGALALIPVLGVVAHLVSGGDPATVGYVLIPLTAVLIAVAALRR